MTLSGHWEQKFHFLLLPAPSPLSSLPFPASLFQPPFSPFLVLVSIVALVLYCYLFLCTGVYLLLLVMISQLLLCVSISQLSHLGASLPQA